ncbi:hypothetical protein K438DRAFT_1836832 [Mycena galopus ATCC 62051]|nr:hypothetical protein K438DRAFT_1836832 [Mycena galopus ATCC 62051]
MARIGFRLYRVWAAPRTTTMEAESRTEHKHLGNIPWLRHGHCSSVASLSQSGHRSDKYHLLGARPAAVHDRRVASASHRNYLAFLLAMGDQFTATSRFKIFLPSICRIKALKPREPPIHSHRRVSLTTVRHCLFDSTGMCDACDPTCCIECFALCCDPECCSACDLGCLMHCMDGTCAASSWMPWWCPCSSDPYSQSSIPLQSPTTQEPSATPNMGWGRDP